LAAAVARETQRVLDEVGPQESHRVLQALTHFTRYLGPATPLDRIPADVLNAYQIHRVHQDNRSRKTVRLEVRYIARMFQVLELPLARPRPLRIGATTPNRAFSADELTRFFQACGPRYRLLFLVLYATGCRSAELLPSSNSSHVPLLRSEVDPDAATITIRPAKDKPGHRSVARLIPVDPALARALLAPHPAGNTGNRPGSAAPPCGIIEVVPPASSLQSPVFGLRGDTLWRRFDHILARARIPKTNPLGEKLTAHSFRHTRATQLLAQTGDLDLVRRFLGHTTLTMTQHYAQGRTTAPIVNITPFLQETAL